VNEPVEVEHNVGVKVLDHVAGKHAVSLFVLGYEVDVIFLQVLDQYE